MGVRPPPPACTAIQQPAHLMSGQLIQVEKQTRGFLIEATRASVPLPSRGQPRDRARDDPGVLPYAKQQ